MTPWDRQKGATSALLDAETLVRLNAIRIDTRRRSSNALMGHHASANHGVSIEFAEHKEYSPGDDTRPIDWRVAARQDRLYIKRFEDETNLKCFVLVDTSGSMGYASGETTKLEYAAQIAGAIAFILLQQTDSVGLLGFDSEVGAYVPPRSRSDHLQVLASALLNLEPAGETSIEGALEHILERTSGRSLIVVLSDFFDASPRLGRIVRQVAEHHENALRHVLDPAAQSVPFDQVTLFQAMESSEEVLAEPRVIRATYLEEMERFRARIRREALQAGADYCLLSSDVPVDVAIRSWRAGERVPGEGGADRAV